jgi:hypothetical protein
MAKSKVIKELANNEITLEIALNRLMIIASDIENDELSKWAEKELNGYLPDDAVPDYRVVKNTQILYSGINGRYQVTRTPLPLREILGEKPETFFVNIFDGIGSIENYIKGPKEGEFMIDLTYFAGEVDSRTGIKCTSISQIVPSNAFEDTLNVVKTTLLKVFIKLDKSYGSLDDLDIDTSDKTTEEVEKINTTINHIIYNDNRITIGDKNKISDSRITGQGVANNEER